MALAHEPLGRHPLSLQTPKKRRIHHTQSSRRLLGLLSVRLGGLRGRDDLPICRAGQGMPSARRPSRKDSLYSRSSATRITTPSFGSVNGPEIVLYLPRSRRPRRPSRRTCC